MTKTFGIVATLLPGAAQATPVAQYTAINGNGESGSQDGASFNLNTVLGTAYGVGTLTRTGVNFSGGGLTFTRVADFYADDVTSAVSVGNIFDLHDISAVGTSDQYFQDGTRPVQARGLFSGASQRIGFRDINTGTDTVLFDAPSQLSYITDSVTQTFSSNFTFVRADAFPLNGPPNLNNVRYSANGLNNPTAGDNFVAYVLTGIVGGPRLVVCVEDQNTGDFDYQDFIFEVSLVPNPLAAHGALAGLAGVGILGFRRRRA